MVAVAPAQAELTRLEIEKREIVAGGQSFGDAGAYEKLTGRAYFEVDPEHKRNKTITDVKRAPVNFSGRVEFSADMVILKPVDMQKSSGMLFFEVNNRGNKISFGGMHDTPANANRNDPMAPEDFGNGFIMRRGHVMAMGRPGARTFSPATTGSPSTFRSQWKTAKRWRSSSSPSSPTVISAAGIRPRCRYPAGTLSSPTLPSPVTKSRHGRSSLCSPATRPIRAARRSARRAGTGRKLGLCRLSRRLARYPV